MRFRNDASVSKFNHAKGIKWLLTEAKLFFEPREMVASAGNFKLYLQREFVLQPEHFNGLFAKGDKVLQAHLEAVNPIPLGGGFKEARDLRVLIRKFKKHVPELTRKYGYVGVYGDSLNTELVDFAVRRLGGIKIKPPHPDGRNRAEHAVIEQKFPARFLKVKPQRVIMRFA